MIASGAELATSLDAASVVEDALGVFAKALRAMQLYLPNNPTRAAAMERVGVAFAKVWRVADPLQIRIKETSFEWEGRTVYRDLERGTDGLPWLLYRDGLRTLTLHPGFETTELSAILKLFQAARSASPDEDDLVTLLWAADFSSLEYTHVEHDSDGDVPFARGTETGSGTMSGAPPAELMPVGEDAPSGTVRVEDFDSTLYFLDPGEVEYLQSELAREYATDHRRLVLASLLDIVEGQAILESRTEALATIDQLFIEFLSVGEFALVAYCLREAAAAARRMAVEDECLPLLRGLSARLSEPSAMSQLLQAIDEHALSPAAALFEELLMELRPSALEPLLLWLGRETASPARAIVGRAALRVAMANTAMVAQLLEHTDESVVYGALQLAAQVATPATVPALSRLLRSGSESLRVEAIKVLGEIKSPAALQAVERGIDDGSREVRVAVYRVLATYAYTPALPRLLTALRRKELRTADLSEKMALFDAFGRTCGDAGVAELDTVLNARGLLGPREPADLRACAARTLGMLATPLAIEALGRAADTKDIVVRSAVARAMRGNS